MVDSKGVAVESYSTWDGAYWVVGVEYSVCAECFVVQEVPWISNIIFFPR